MEARKHLIVIKGKDQTDSVASFRFRDGKCEVIYSCAPDKAYIFQRGNVEILPLQKKINPAQVIVTVNGRNIGEIDELLDFGAYYRIVRSHPAGSASSTSSEGLPEHRHHYAIPRQVAAIRKQLGDVYQETASSRSFCFAPIVKRNPSLPQLRTAHYL